MTNSSETVQIAPHHPFIRGVFGPVDAAYSDIRLVFEPELGHVTNTLLRLDVHPGGGRLVVVRRRKVERVGHIALYSNRHIACSSQGAIDDLLLSQVVLWLMSLFFPAYRA
jgi:hypothetical protein